MKEFMNFVVKHFFDIQINIYLILTETFTKFFF